MTDELTRVAPARPRDLLARVLDEPGLVDAVRALPPRALGALVEHVGLEDAGEIVALATPEQLARVLDHDLWRQGRPGADEELDGDRFALWLEVLLEAGDASLADMLVELPEELVTLGLHRQVLVLDMDALASEVAGLDHDDADLVEKALDDTLHHELEGFRVISRRHDGWDAVLSTLIQLDERHHDFLRRVLERLAAAEGDLVRDPLELRTALTLAEQLAEDAAAERDERRAAEGWVAPSDARAFLALARAVTPDEILAETRRDPVTRAYFRELAPRAAEAQVHAGEAHGRSLLRLLRDAGVAVAPAPRLRLGRGDDDARHLGEAMRALAARAPALHAERVEELAYLVNVLVAGGSRDGRRPRPAEAAEDVVAACARGLAHAERAGRTLDDVSAVQLFRVGCSRTADAGDATPRRGGARPSAARAPRSRRATRRSAP